MQTLNQVGYLPHASHSASRTALVASLQNDITRGHRCMDKFSIQTVVRFDFSDGG
jgi:hypothetical protein